MASNFLTWPGPCFRGANITFGKGSKLVVSQGALVFTQVCKVRGWWESDVLCLDSFYVYVINLVRLMDAALDPVVSAC